MSENEIKAIEHDIEAKLHAVLHALEAKLQNIFGSHPVIASSVAEAKSAVSEVVAPSPAKLQVNDPQNPTNAELGGQAASSAEGKGVQTASPSSGTASSEQIHDETT